MTEFRVIDLRTQVIAPEQTVQASSPEDAARIVLGIDVYRSGAKQHLVARVYWRTLTAPPNMVRLYSKSAYPVAGALPPQAGKARTRTPARRDPWHINEETKQG